MTSQLPCSSTPKTTCKRKYPSLFEAEKKNFNKPDDLWKDVNSTIRKMDALYDASFYSWLKNEENVLVTSIYLHRIANEYNIDRIVTALRWLTIGWRLESIVLLVQHITLDWAVPMPGMTEQAVQAVLDLAERKRAHLIRDLTKKWSCNSLAKLVGGLMNGWICMKQKERLLSALTFDWDFRQLSEFFSYLQTSTNLNYQFKVSLLQEAARRDKTRHTKYLTSAKSPAIISSPRRRRSRQVSNLAYNKIKANSACRSEVGVFSQTSEILHRNSTSLGSLATESINSPVSTIPLPGVDLNLFI